MTYRSHKRSVKRAAKRVVRAVLRDQARDERRERPTLEDDAIVTRAERKQRTRNHLLESALRLMQEGRSFTSLGLREVTREAGGGPASISPAPQGPGTPAAGRAGRSAPPPASTTAMAAARFSPDPPATQ